MGWQKIIHDGQTGTVTTGMLAATSVTTAKIAGDAVTNAKIVDNAIDSEHYTDGSIDTAHIADDQITLAKMAHGIDGNLITYDAAGAPAAVATGTSAQVLTSNGAGAAPTFQAAATGGVSKTGTPANNEVAVWTDSSTIEGESLLTYNGGLLTVSKTNGVAGNALSTLLVLEQTTNQTPAVGIGVGINFKMENAVNVSNTFGQFQCVSTDIASGGEDAKFVFKLDRAGTLTDALTIDSLGNMTVSGDLTVTGTNITTTTETILINDNKMVLNADKSNAADIDAAIFVERGSSGNNKMIVWDEGDDKWQLKSDSAIDFTSNTYEGDIASIEVNTSYDSGSTVVPIGHFQWDGSDLYLRTS